MIPTGRETSIGDYGQRDVGGSRVRQGTILSGFCRVLTVERRGKVIPKKTLRGSVQKEAFGKEKMSLGLGCCV